MTLPNWLPEKPTRIAVAMSGGVDSSVVAHLLHAAGHHIVGLTAWTLNGPGSCCNDALVNAGRVCETLGVPFDTVDLRAEFSHYVMDYYNNSYAAGLTPNPCVECNRYVKWEKLVDYAKTTHGVDYIATGHYIRRGTNPDGTASILRARDERKDQTYMMARVYPKDIETALFPLGNRVKSEVYEYARKHDLPSAYSKESMDVCFVLDGQANYLNGVLGKKPGPIVHLETGAIVGEHDGTHFYTVGQRKGVKVAAGVPIYVIKTDSATNTVYVGPKEALETHSLKVLSINWLVKPLSKTFSVMVKTRYASSPKPAIVHLESTTEDAWVELQEPQEGIAKGQIAAFYDESFTQLLGGGFIGEYLQHAPFNADAPRELPNLFCSSP
jgi:tRNA-uridine 2-sulfurtransferase